MIRHTTSNRVPKIMPFQEPVTYYARLNNTDTFMSHCVTRAHQKEVDKKETGVSPEILQVAELIWQIQKGYISVTPVVDDYLTDAGGTRWVVLAVTTGLNSWVFDLFCKRGV